MEDLVLEPSSPIRDAPSPETAASWVDGSRPPVGDRETTPTECVDDPSAGATAGVRERPAADSLARDVVKPSPHHSFKVGQVAPAWDTPLGERRGDSDRGRASRIRTPGPVRVAIDDPHELDAAGLADLISNPAGDLYRVVTHSRSNPPDVLLYSVHRDHARHGHDQHLHALLRTTPSTVIATHWDETSTALRTALACGAHGSLSKKLPRQSLLQGISAMLDRRQSRRTPAPLASCHPVLARVGLTTRELEVLRLIGAGLTNVEIADGLFLSINTVKTYIRGAYGKIGVERRAQAVIWVEEHGLALAPRHPDHRT